MIWNSDAISMCCDREMRCRGILTTTTTIIKPTGAKIRFNRRHHLVLWYRAKSIDVGVPGAFSRSGGLLNDCWLANTGRSGRGKNEATNQAIIPISQTHLYCR